MDTPYDYIQIVKDADWSLIGIIPPGTYNNKIKNKLNSEQQSGNYITEENVDLQSTTNQIKEPILNQKFSEQENLQYHNKTKNFDFYNSELESQETFATNTFPMPQKLSEATIINLPKTSRRKPITQLISKNLSQTYNENSSDLFLKGPDDVLDFNLKSKCTNNKFLVKKSEKLPVTFKTPKYQLSTNDITFSKQNATYEPQTEKLFNLSSLTMTHNRENLLVGFGK